MSTAPSSDLVEAQSQEETLPALKKLLSWAWWLIPIILATQGVKIGGIKAQGKPGQKFPRPHLNQ
jgi:hypothetical protein